MGCELEQDTGERGAIVFVEGREDLFVDASYELAEACKSPPAEGREAHDVAAPGVRVAAAFDQVVLLECVQESDERAAVEVERVGDRSLCLACVFVEER